MAVEMVDTWQCPVHGIIYYHLRGHQALWYPSDMYCCLVDDVRDVVMEELFGEFMIPEVVDQLLAWMPTDIFAVCGTKLAHVVLLNDPDKIGTNVEGLP